MNRSNALIEIDGIRKSFGTFEVLKGISLSVGKGRLSASSDRPVPESRPFCAASTA